MSNESVKVKKLFVLGAGSSFAATRGVGRSKANKLLKTQIPLDKDFASALLKVSDGRSEWIGKSLQKIQKLWEDPTPFNEMGLEEAILAQSANMQFSYSGNQSASFTDYLQHLVHLIAIRLKQAREGDEEIYSRFAATFFKSKKTQHKIITFNYDDILDRVLLENYDYTVRTLYSSVIRPDQSSKDFESAIKGGRMLDNPAMIKMHGSVNWNCTSEDFYKMMGQDLNQHNYQRNLRGIWYKEDGCPPFDKDGGISPCIIPPINAKPVTEITQFRAFWRKAREYLSQCQELYVCGYSLPPTDVLARSLFKNFINKRLKKITIIDPNHSVMKDWRKMLVRPPDVNKVEWAHFEDFGEFVDWVET